MNASSALFEDDRESLSLDTPEGVPLHFRIPSAGDRLYAFVIDSVVLIAGVIGLVLSIGFLPSFGYDDTLYMFAIYGWFYGYFPISEAVFRGRTLGKRVAGLRVIDRGGRQLTSRQIFARNLTRYLELLIPMQVLLSDVLTEGWQLLSLGWLFVLMLLPFFNRHRLRLGDFIAQTIVVRAPKVKLERDLTTKSTRQTGGSESAEYQYTFTKAELTLYGIYELQTLEKVLRTPQVPKDTCVKLRRTIWRKMSRSAPPKKMNDRQFLLDFYAQLRAELEHHLLFGERRERKKSGRLIDIEKRTDA